jgi:hypothetical protein
MTDATEGSHMGHADFRVGGRIFATISLEPRYAVLLLTPEQQAGMVADAPEVFSPVPGGWGKNGSTRILLEAAPPDIVESAIRTAWQNRVSKNVRSGKRK